MIRVIEKSQEDIDLEMVDKGMIGVAVKLTFVVLELRSIYDKFWGLPDDRLLAVMNKIGPQKLSQIFAQNTALGEAVNASLDAINLENFKLRAPVVPKREDVVFDINTGKFVIAESYEDEEADVVSKP